MCKMVVSAVEFGEAQVLHDVRKILADPEYTPKKAAELCNRLLVTCYMGTENSSSETRQRASKLANQIGSDHLEVNIDGAVSSMLNIFNLVTGLMPKVRLQFLKTINFRAFNVLFYTTKVQSTWWLSSSKPSFAEYSGAIADGALLSFCTIDIMGSKSARRITCLGISKCR